jgi:lysozyme family protein
MAQFEPAVQNTLLWEGGYSNNPADSGGETYRGISRNNWPNWNGWGYVDIERTEPNFPANLDQNLGLQGNVIDFYRQNYWQYDAITSQAVANKIFDLAVNVGQVHAIKIVQGAVEVKQDGILGPNTIAAINNYSPTPNGSLLYVISGAAISYHNQIVNIHPQDAVFLAGWIRRDQAI